MNQDFRAPQASAGRVGTVAATAVRRRDRLGGLVHEYYEAAT
jgi:hypothetical protein